jgi:hypothetical protein
MPSILSRALLLVIPVVIVLGVPGETRAQIVVTISPPAAYIATSQPEYFEGRPVYYYNNNWYYRDHGRWSYYRREPVYLRDRRAHWAPARRDRREDRRDDRRDNRRDDHRDDRRDGRYHYRR